MNQTLWITGASGFIGGYLCQYFSEKGYSVIASARRITQALQDALPKCALIELDVLKPETFPATIQAEVLIHTATANDIVSRDTLAGIELSAVGTQNMLQLASKHHIPTMMVFSTFQIYGTELIGLIDETTLPAPVNDYGLNHLFAEDYVAMAVRKGQLESGIVLRPSNVYGRFAVPTVNRWTLVPGCFCKEAIEHGKITLKSSGQQNRNFVSLENISRACETIIQKGPTGYNVFNIGSTHSESILSVAKRVQQAYQHRYNKELPVLIESNQPAIGNDFTVSLDKLTATWISRKSNLHLRYRDRVLIETTSIRPNGDAPHRIRNIPEQYSPHPPSVSLDSLLGNG